MIGINITEMLYKKSNIVAKQTSTMPSVNGINTTVKNCGAL